MRNNTNEINSLIDALNEVARNLNVDTKSIADTLLDNIKSQIERGDNNVTLEDNKKLLEEVVDELKRRHNKSVSDILDNL